MTIPFWKVQSIGNHFVLIRNLDLDLRELAKRLCAHHFGIGADGLLVVESNDAGLKLRMFNPDGTEDFCGNGLRCAAWWAKHESELAGARCIPGSTLERGPIKEPFSISHGGRNISIWIDGDRITTVLDPATYDPALVPHRFGREIAGNEVEAGGLSICAHLLSTGSTHCVVFVDELPEDREFREKSSCIENDPMFPERTSVIWAIRSGLNELRLRIWERGVGETLGCGTGSMAAAIALRRELGGTGPIAVHNPGGTVAISLETWDGSPSIEGSAQIVYHGQWD